VGDDVAGGAPAVSQSGVYLGSWRNRRRVIFLALGYCAVSDAYLIVLGTDTALHQQMAIAHVMLAGAVIGSYVFGAVWDDHSIRHAERD
jgi:hypothetical protein